MEIMNPINDPHPHTHYQKEHPHTPYFRRFHRDWKFWVAVLCMLFAMWVYVRSNDLSVRPNSPPQQPVP